MRTYFCILITLVCLASRTYSQTSTLKGVSLSVSGGNFSVGHEYITGIWTGVEVAKAIGHSRTS
jgi:ascorbate-specific PTS system EIIC-type component UlaA